MKRFLPLFLVAVLVCSIMIVPAFAAETLVFDTDLLSDQVVELGAPLQGEYLINFYYDDGSLAFSLEPADFTFPTEVSYSYTFRDVSFQIIFWYTEDSLKVTCSSFGCTDLNGDEKCSSLAVLFPDVTTFEFVPVGSDVPDPVPDPEPVSPIAGIFGVFTGVGSWLAGQLGTTTSLFWNGQGLTFLGVLSVSGLALAVVLLLVMVVVRFLRFRS